MKRQAKTQNRRTSHTDSSANGLQIIVPSHYYRSAGKGGDDLEVLRDISLHVPIGQFTTVVGGSGAGKTTLLRIVAGLITPTDGECFFNGEVINGPGRDRAFVFQEHNLLPWLTARENVEWGAKLLGLAVQEYRIRTSSLFEEIGLAGFESSYPDQLSGGMKQRVGVARALCADPPLLLMDEPFSAVDAQTRDQLQRLLLSLLEGAQRTILFVTHDIDEAILLSDDVVVLSGRPGMIRDTVKIDFPRPRQDAIGDLRRSDRWEEYRERIWAGVHMGSADDDEEFVH